MKQDIEKNKEDLSFKDWKKNIVLFLTSQSISLFGSSLVQYAIIWYITLTTKSGMMMTISTICGFLPQLLISFFGGVWADRYNKKYIIAIADSAIAVSTLLVALCFVFGIESIWLLFIALAIRSLGAGVQTPTVNAIIPNLVPQDKLMRVNGINTTIQSIMLILSPAAAGAIMPMMPIGYILFIDVITAIIGVGIFALGVKYKHIKKEENLEKGYFKSIVEGLKYVNHHKFIKRFLLYYIVISILIAPIGILTPLMVTRTFGDEAWRLTLNEIVFFVGSIVGGGIISTWGGFKNKIYTLALGCFLCGIFGIAMGMVSLANLFIFYLITMGLLGIIMPFFNTPAIVILQETVEENMYGRVFSIVNIIGSGIMPLSMLLFGPLSDVITIESILIVSSIFFAFLPLVFIKDKTIKNIPVINKSE
ncbi:MAG: MFS transporter [Clostridia bacterium]